MWGKNEVRFLPHRYTKMNSEWIKDLNSEKQMLKVLEKNTGYLCS